MNIHINYTTFHIFLAAIIFTTALNAAETCYTFSEYPSIGRIIVSDGKLQVMAVGKQFNSKKSSGPGFSYNQQDASWEYVGEEKCQGRDCYQTWQGCRYRLPNFDIDKSQLNELKQNGYIADKPEVSACVKHNDYIYFGLRFYWGEGYKGIGGIGRYDTKTEKLEIRYPKMLRETSVNYIAHDGHSLWLSTAGHYECSGSPPTKGILRYSWDKKRIYPFGYHNENFCGFVANDMKLFDGDLWVSSDFGISKLTKIIDKSISNRPYIRYSWQHFAPYEKNGKLSMKQTSCKALHNDVLRNIVNTKSNTFSVYTFNPLVSNMSKFRSEEFNNFLMSLLKENGNASQ